MWAATWCCIVFLAIVNDAVEAAESFGCRNSLISDEWREMVLTFHNKKRRTVSVGDQVSKDNQKLPAAKKMNKLTWDCNLEREATDGAAKCASYTKAGHGINEKVFAAGNTCNIETKTREVLNEWWDEITTRELVDQKYLDNSGLGDFANMAYWETNAFACSTAKCSDGIRLLCIYNKLGKENDKVLYEKEANANDACNDCPADSPCVDRLCQPKFTITDDSGQCADDGMTNDMTNTALYMHNYYRGLLGTGWAEDKISTYAPLAKAMPQLKYQCDTIAKEAKDRAQACEETPADPTAPRSQNYLIIKDLSMDKEEALEKAISTWWEELADIGVGSDTTYTGKIAKTLTFYSNMAYDQTTQIGCSVEKCTKKGFILVVCQYDKKISEGEKIYETAKSGEKACSGCSGKKCGTVEGLCAAAP